MASALWSWSLSVSGKNGHRRFMRFRLFLKWYMYSSIFVLLIIMSLFVTGKWKTLLIDLLNFFNIFLIIAKTLEADGEGLLVFGVFILQIAPYARPRLTIDILYRLIYDLYVSFYFSGYPCTRERMGDTSSHFWPSFKSTQTAVSSLPQVRFELFVSVK